MVIFFLNFFFNKVLTFKHPLRRKHRSIRGILWAVYASQYNIRFIYYINHNILLSVLLERFSFTTLLLLWVKTLLGTKLTSDYGQTDVCV